MFETAEVMEEEEDPRREWEMLSRRSCWELIFAVLGCLLLVFVSLTVFAFAPGGQDSVALKVVPTLASVLLLVSMVGGAWYCMQAPPKKL
jgi:hypothetical protein